MSPARRAAFTLIELMISTALALAMLSLATTAFFRFRSISERAETRLALHTSAQRLFTQLQRTFACVQPSCAFVVRTTAGSEIRLVFMRAKEHNWDFMIPSSTSVVNPDLVWEEWVWTRADGTLRNAASSTGTASSPGRSFTSGSFTPAGVNYSGKTFKAVPQPRRTLDTSDPFHAASGGLDDNMLFPAGPYPATSLANATGDLGDFSDLERNLIPVTTQMSDLSCEILCHDGTSVTVDDSATTSPPRVFQGVWLDGRLAATLAAAPVYNASELAKRPRLLRMRFTLADAKTGLSCPFSFSFALPDLAPRQ